MYICRADYGHKHLSGFYCLTLKKFDVKDFKEIGLFGCNTGKDWVSRYEKILVKIMFEDDEFFTTDAAGIDANDFNMIPEMKLIVGTYKDMYIRDGVKASYDQVYAELAHKYGDDEIRMEIIKSIFDDIREMEISDDERVVYRNQFRDWKNFTIATKIMNIWMEFLKNDIRNGDRKRMYDVMKKMREMSSLLPEYEIKKAPREWN